VLAFEMETSALYYLAARAFAAGEDVRAATILTVSDVLSEEETSEGSYLPLSELEKAIDAMIEVGLEAASASL
jgi:purine-nucleoside phosphorylase